MRKICIFIFLVMATTIHLAQTSEIFLAKSGSSPYSILLSEDAGANEKEAANVLNNYFTKVTGISLPISQQQSNYKTYIILREKILQDPATTQDSFEIKNEDQNIVIIGHAKKGILYAVYHFIETYLKCRKWAPNEPVECPNLKELKIKLPIDINESPSFQYREVHSTAIKDQEYMDWNKLHYLEELWGLWGHSYHKLVDPEYYKTNPEYFAFFKGKRRPEQLCLSNEKVMEESIKTLEKLFQENPTAQYWSISPNDEIGYCECDLCAPINHSEGGPQGPLVKFINKIAEKYPDKKFTMLAYGATSRPTLKTKPRENVIIFLSNIDAYRNDPIGEEKSAASFRNNLEGWLQQTPNVLIWDYYTQFTNYLAPFPDVLNITENLNFYHQMKVEGIFAQLGGSNYVHQNELKTYILAKKLWNNEENAALLLDEFLKGYYHNGAPYIKEYLLKIKNYLNESGRNLDIYGNPVNEYNTYLTPEIMDELSNLFDKAELAETDSMIKHRIHKLRLAFDFTYLQQARFYGRDKNGIYIQNKKGKWIVNNEVKKRVKRFTTKATKEGILQLSESGYPITEYLIEWKKIFQTGALPNLAMGATVHFEKLWIPDFPAKKEKTLTDGMYGLKDFSYNWLLFNESNTITIHLDEPKKVLNISASFLEDQRHWIFLPKTIKIAVSKDGQNYRDLPIQHFQTTENYLINPHEVSFTMNDTIQYIRFSFEPLNELPEWKNNPSKNPLIAIDEIWVN